MGVVQIFNFWSKYLQSEFIEFILVLVRVVLDTVSIGINDVPVGLSEALVLLVGLVLTSGVVLDVGVGGHQGIPLVIEIVIPDLDGRDRCK